MYQSYVAKLLHEQQQMAFTAGPACIDAMQAGVTLQLEYT